MPKKRRPKFWYEEYRPSDPRLWLYGPVPSGFWGVSENRRLYMEWLGEQLGFKQPEDWYKIKKDHFYRYRGGRILIWFKGVRAAVKEFLPDYDWKEWLFGLVPKHFWRDPANHRRYLNWLGEQLGFQRPDDWYRLSCKQVSKRGGKKLLAHFHYSLPAILREYLPDQEWQEWRFPNVPEGFWDRRANRRRYLDWLGEQLGFQRPDDWYALSNRHLEQHHGYRLLWQFGYSCSAIMKDYLPRYPWQEWRFTTVSDGFWDDPANRRCYLDWLGKQLGFRQLGDWHQLTSAALWAHRGGTLLYKFAGSPYAVVKDYQPHYQWQEWRFDRVPGGFWHDPANRQRYMDWLGQQLDFRRLEDWYQITKDHFGKYYGHGLTTVFEGSPVAILRDYRPDYDWKEWLLSEVPKGFWTKLANRRRYLDWLGEQLGFRHPDDWYALSNRHLEEHRGHRLLWQFGYSCSAIMKDYLPRYPWHEWCFRSVPNGFWRDPANRYRYLDWLGTQLGYRRPEDWQRLRAADVKKHHGYGLLEEFRFHGIASIVAEYFSHKKKERWPRENKEG